MEKREVGRDGVAKLTWDAFYQRPYMWTPVQFVAWTGGDAIVTQAHITVREGNMVGTFDVYDVETAISRLRARCGLTSLPLAA